MKQALSILTSTLSLVATVITVSLGWVVMTLSGAIVMPLSYSWHTGRLSAEAKYRAAAAAQSAILDLFHAGQQEPEASPDAHGQHL